MYKKIKFYYCSMCGVGQRAQHKPIGDYCLPSRWSGSKRRKGDCICSDCYDAMRELAKNKKKEEN